MEHINYEFEVPAGYREVFHFDAKDRKDAVKMTIWAVIIMVIAVVLVILGADFKQIDMDYVFKYYAVWIVSMIVYIVLHELVHGAVYKALTHRKLTFGITWSAAFCGVPDIYVYRNTALASLVAPLTVFTVLLVPLTLWLRTVDMGWYMVSGLLFAIHISGCAGDLYITKMLLTKFKDPRILMRDTGPAQWIFKPEDAA
ncbi:MAG: DUF3267 domain-containing protein [Firmicutes bacterium]|nr:DUF3267 domain-containing protein [Bacillota bacterium]